MSIQLDTVSYWLAFGAVGMSLGSLAILALTSKMRDEDRHHGYVALAITLIAATAYFALWQNVGDITVHGQTFQLARYIDWVFTTPLLLFSLLAVGLPSINSSKSAWSTLGLLVSVVALDVFMIVTGVIASVVAVDNRWPWYVFSCLALIVITLMLYSTVYKQSKKLVKPAATKLYINLTVFLTVLWVAYPVVWLLGGTGVGSISAVSENMAYAILDVTAKVGFGLLLLAGLSDLTSKTKPKKGMSTIDANAK